MCLGMCFLRNAQWKVNVRAVIGGIADPIMGAAAGDTLTSINRHVREPLRVEFGGGERWGCAWRWRGELRAELERGCGEYD